VFQLEKQEGRKQRVLSCFPDSNRDTAQSAALRFRPGVWAAINEDPRQKPRTLDLGLRTSDFNLPAFRFASPRQFAITTSAARMFWKKKNPEEHRYYLLPGQGRSNRRKRRQQLIAALITGAIFSAGIGAALWFMHRP